MMLLYSFKLARKTNHDRNCNENKIYLCELECSSVDKLLALHHKALCPPSVFHRMGEMVHFYNPSIL